MGTGVSPSPSHSIVTQIATIEGVEPTDLEPPLHDVVDPEALDRVVESGRAGLEVAFTYRDHRVRVSGDGSVDVTASNAITDASGESTEETHGD